MADMTGEFTTSQYKAHLAHIDEQIKIAGKKAYANRGNSALYQRYEADQMSLRVYRDRIVREQGRREED